MKLNSTHKNLNTSYINLSALLKFLQQKNFVGNIHFEAKGYEADVFFTKENGLKVRENDHLAGRISVGNDVLARILVRAHEPDGTINVYDEIEEVKAVVEKSSDNFEPELIESEIVQTLTEPPELSLSENETVTELKKETAKVKPVSLKEKLGLPSLPFSFRKKALKKSEEEAEQPKEEKIEQQVEVKPANDWQELLDLISEILQTVEKSLADENLNFAWVFDKVRTEVFEDYPFLHPNSTVFEYKNGKILMSEQINNNLFIASIAEVLRLLLGKFETHPKFAEVHRSVVRDILELMNKRHTQYDKFLITQQLEKVI